MNEKLGKVAPPRKNDIVDPSPKCSGDSCQLLDEGTKVRVMLDEPRNALTGQRLHGKFRTGDMRFENKVRTIEQISLRPGQPPMYLISGIPNVAYTKNQLQVVPDDEHLPPPSILPKFIVEKIVDKRRRNGRVEYLINLNGMVILMKAIHGSRE